MATLSQLVKTKSFPFSLLSAISIIVGVIWLLQLPTEQQLRNTYISENALLPGQVHTYFGGSEQNVFRAYHHEVSQLADAPSEKRVEVLRDIFEGIGVKFASQKYKYTASGEEITGENGYALLQAPRGDATEALVLCAGWRTSDGELNKAGVALLLTLTRYLKRWSLWSKDIIFLITEDSRAGPQAWVDAYHDSHSKNSVESLLLKSGAIQGAIALDYPQKNFGSFHVLYDGINGQLPNLDLINTLISIAQFQMNIPCVLQEMHRHSGKYNDNLKTMLRGMVNQALGHSSGAHSSFIPYHIDAITIQAHGDGWHSEVALGRTLESCLRSLNNLLEHFHQSFFFYLLMAPRRFVSIGTYLPSAMLIAVNFTITAIGIWLKYNPIRRPEPAAVEKPESASRTVSGSGERDVFRAITIVVISHLFGIVPLQIFNHIDQKYLSLAFAVFTASASVIPFVFAFGLRQMSLTTKTRDLIKCFSLLCLGIFLSTLATINFSLSFVIGIFSVPITFVQPDGSLLHKVAMWLLLQLASPTCALLAVGRYWHLPVAEILKESAFGWTVWGMWTPVVVWCVWLPAWISAAVLLALPSSKKTDAAH